MNLRLCVHALLMLWVSLIAVSGGECAPPARPRSPRGSPGAAAVLLALRPTCALSASWSRVPAGLEQPRAGRARLPTDRLPPSRFQPAVASGIIRSASPLLTAPCSTRSSGP